MSSLESKTQPIVEGLCTDTMTEVSPEHTATLAIWAAKTSIILDYTSTKPLVPEHRRNWVYEKQAPANDTVIGLVRYDGNRHVTAHSRRFGFFSQDDTFNHPDGHFDMFSVGAVMFLVVSINRNFGPRASARLRFVGEVKPLLFHLWPTAGRIAPIKWPKHGMDDTLRTKIDTQPPERTFEVDIGIAARS
jgi:hypothetical protein